jgi:hypothetical protein
MVSAPSIRVLAACFVTATIALAATVLLGGSAPSLASTTDPGSTDARAPFAVFSRPQRGGDQLPPAVREQFAPLALERGLDLDAARAVAPAGRGYVWLLAGPDAVCIAIPDTVDGFGLSCNDANGAAAGRLWVGMNAMPGQKAGDVRAAILVPDGVEAVTAVATDGARRTLPVSDNVAFADLVASDHVELAEGGSVTSVDLPGTPAALVSGE